MNDPGTEATVRADTRHRVLKAFVNQSRSGEPQPGPRTRLLVLGVVAALLLLTGGAVGGRLTPSSPGGWSDGDVVVGRSSAARLVSMDGVLHPLLNTSSGRLLRPASSSSSVAIVEDAVIAGARRGAPLGIPGAPDVLPVPTALIQTGWLACLDGTRVRTRITATTTGSASRASSAVPSPDERAVVVSVDGHPDTIYLVVGDHRYPIPATSFPAVKQYLDQTSSPRTAASGWVDLFPAGTALAFGSFRFVAPATVGQPTGAGLSVPGTVPRIGQLVTNTDRSDSPFVIVADGTVPLTTFAAAVYRGTAPPDLGTPLAVTDADLARLPPSSSESFVPLDWPTAPPPAGPDTSGSTSATSSTSAAAAGAQVPCAELATAAGRSPSTRLRFTPAPSTSDASPSTPAAPAAPASSSVDSGDGPAPVVGPDSGAVITVVTGPDERAKVYLVDPSGRAFPVGDPAADTLARLGYASVVPPVVPAGWIALCPPGPELSAAAAQLPGKGSTSS